VGIVHGHSESHIVGIAEESDERIVQGHFESHTGCHTER
jgi:hypothetical protein